MMCGYRAVGQVSTEHICVSDTDRWSAQDEVCCRTDATLCAQSAVRSEEEDGRQAIRGRR